MKELLKKIKSFLIFDTYGNIATASFLICVVSGIFLALPFDIAKPYESTAQMILTNPFASFARNLHYWSAQLFLVFSFLHIWDHFKKKTEGKLKSAVWLRLTISILAMLFVMLSGFILKGDADSMQAFRILESIINSIPLIGSAMSFTFIGSEEDLQILYMNHIATASIFLAIIIYEHARYIWTKASTTIFTIFYTVILSFIFTPYLHDNFNPIIKGPWYFLGLQEILHWISYPVYSILLIALLLTLFYFIPKFSENKSRQVKYILLYTFWFYLILTVFAYYFRGENWNFVLPWNNPYVTSSNFTSFDFTNDVDDSLLTQKEIPVVMGRAEGCLVCHSNVEGFSPAHDPNAIGCSSCHAGNPFTLNKNTAHSEMILIPGNLDFASRTCGNIDCHPAVISRVENSIMTTLSGMISVNKWVFDEIENPDGVFHIKEIGGTPAESHLRNLCASCHIGGMKNEYGPITQLSRGGGCNACHLNYSTQAEDQLNEYILQPNESSLPKLHPSLSLDISNDHCFGCHSRSGRIAANYEGWHETKFEKSEVEGKDGYRVLEDERVFEFVKADVHHESGMDCIDCHNSYEVMGDGNIYQHKEEQVKIKCTDCHLTGEPKTMKYSEFDFESKKIAEIRELDDTGKNYLISAESGFPLINTYVNELNEPRLVTKRTKKDLPMNPPLPVCIEGKSHKDLSCSTCHTSWMPQCIGCHTDYDPEAQSFDLLENKEITGEWVEHVGDFFSELPTLGVKENKGARKIDTFMPGMIMTLDKSEYLKSEEDIIFKRLFAPSFSHTIVKESRDCKSCHNNPLAIGFGRGELEYIIMGKTGRWKFTPKYASVKYDGLPEDAWIGFMSRSNELTATRSNARPFNLEEQKNSLRVGSCLVCHDEKSRVMQNSLIDFDAVLKSISDKCVLPDY
ncbi:MAG: cytochrome b N-terminal domain-containing protein [Melioribacteraceae bacterium]|nr:cytochrome b N-terminal domain-containing protein [Melioribacteraceae bacterium]MCF8353609.1 cytochrome b N-terminal domain-containing protein [Melioribacteraceae bacterium]MCF8393532.1 cytochrome b N-terminal domain-containing protein [Melioribacteraceae bacterium]MCF8419342.1 cytochrome b N-terminal domain-containing protein [Melioribacteraceae bacterium]